MACDQVSRISAEEQVLSPLKLDSSTWRVLLFFQASVIVSPEGDTIPQHCPSHCSCGTAGNTGQTW